MAVVSKKYPVRVAGGEHLVEGGIVDHGVRRQPGIAVVSVRDVAGEMADARRELVLWNCGTGMQKSQIHRAHDANASADRDFSC